MWFLKVNPGSASIKEGLNINGVGVGVLRSVEKEVWGRKTLDRV
jgi:hypothetical protein